MEDDVDHHRQNPDPAFFDRASLPSFTWPAIVCIATSSLPLSFYKPWPPIRENVRLFPLRTLVLVRLTGVVLRLALPFVYNFVAGAIAGAEVVSRKLSMEAHVSSVGGQACRKS